MMKFIMFIIFMMLNIKMINMLMLMYINMILLMVISLVFMMSINFNMDWMNLYNWIGVDMISYVMILLSIWIISMMFFVSMDIKNKMKYSLVLLMLLLSLLMSFSSVNYFMFYLYFEISLLPTFLLIMGWGYQPERISASMFMLLYTLFASLPMMLIIFILYDLMNSLNYMIIMNKLLNFGWMEELIYFYMIFAFLVKIPAYTLHFWLPKAHVEAPIAGSMILAGVMLKLGGYGLMRSMLMMLNYSIMMNYFMIINALLGMITLSLVCLRQYDMKVLVAYSSVVHMGMMMCGMMSMMTWGFLGGFMMMFAHGLCSSALFILVNYLYIRTKSRNLYINKGMMMFFPSMSMWWFMICSCNMSSPVSLNLLSELMIVMVMLNWSIYIMILLMLGMYFSAMYSLYLFSYSQHGQGNSLLTKLFNNNILEYNVLLFHWIPLNLLIVKLEMFI
uniref:NADH-ubiquinone oxidoreductase chain 4 n=1 Tax=Anisopteromalus calandrae TaxID=76800 RepID=A0A8E5J5P3_9HYME|nr:NADH dehydrogenase subunit 4 [Anisopteromalus calandrae]QUX32901.1 NADH dehydrogenase subunit 4 [Anisopteromalus calandrae]